MKSLRKTVFLALLLAGCSSVPAIPNVTPYKIDIQQGNYVTQEMVAKLKPGMTRAQVRFVLGTPLVADMFHNDRWDYVYVYRKAGVLTEQRRMTVIFKDDKLARLEGDVVPAKPAAASPESNLKPSSNAAPSAPAKSAPQREPQPNATPTQPDATTLTTTSGAAVASDAKESDSGDGKARAEKPKEEPRKDGSPDEGKGFFGRMLDKLGI